MRWPRLRFTVRRLMIAVAVLAIVLGGSLAAIRLKRYRDECLSRATSHAEWAQMYLDSEKLAREMAEHHDNISAISGRFLQRPKGGPTEGLLRHLSPRRRAFSLETDQTLARLEAQSRQAAEQEKQEAARERANAVRFGGYAAHHAALKRKYLQAATRPWWSVEPDPLSPDPNIQGQYWSERGEYHRALAAYEETLRFEPGDFTALNNLAWLLATCPEAGFRDGKRAVELATRACEVTFRMNPGYVDTLAAAHAEAGDFETAVKVQNEAIGLLPPGAPDAKGFRDRLDGYKANKPYRDMIQATK